ncbi:hypothetical protein [Halalkalibacter krulwichiae]|uniref:Uncharacterized protein n=1 Tax=Halalkalibacter krulwichiae TaxID=199441 RepID=A0A1X9MGT0_9BACI|nr:hypothetical protein [Halalkalibacter krulwichiae]ARK30711.1 hypothetical protein BkAM31D_13220 [Halalkalibacter krulwichiae]
MTKTVRTWLFSAIAILVAVIIGYYVLTAENEPNLHQHGSVISSNLG